MAPKKATKKKKAPQKPAGAKARPAGLTGMQVAFVQEYPKDLNAARAAIRAGYSKKTASAKGWTLMQNPLIAAAIETAIAARAARCEIDSDWVLRNMVNVHEHCTDPDHYEAAAAIRSLELIGRNIGMFRDKVDHTIGLRINHEDALSELE